MKHTTFTALREAGVSRDDVQALARHRDPRTTEIYDLDDAQRRRRALSSLEELERTGRQTGAKGSRDPRPRKPPDPLKSSREKLVGRQGLEPWTLGLKARCSAN